MTPRRKAYNEANKEKIKNSLKAYREKHKEELAAYERRREQSPQRKAMKKTYAKKHYQKYISEQKEYRISHTKERKEWWVKHYAEKKEYYKERNRYYFNTHKKEELQRLQEYTKTERGRLARKKNQAYRKRELGYNILNNKTEGTVGHHIDNINVVYIPEELHTSKFHAMKDEESMKTINIMAWSYLEASVL